MPSFTQLEYEHDDAVVTIRLDRPDTLNALSPVLLDELVEALAEATATENARVVVLRGKGRAFSSGYDIGADERELSPDDRMFEQRTHLEAIFSSRLPVIAAVDGSALAGGCNLAICCDLTIATENAEFGYPDMHFGEPPPKFLVPFLTNSLKHARELLYSGKSIDASEAHRMGLVNRVVPAGELDDAIDEEIDHILKTPSTAVSLVKDMINDVQETQGYRRYGRLEEHLATLTMETATPNRFREIRDEEGLTAALEWMHGTDKP